MEAKKPYIIAEIGSNWRVYDDKEKNKVAIGHQIRQVRCAGADAVKFQYVTSKELYGKQIPRLDKYHLYEDILVHSAKLAEIQEIDFMCTAFSKEGYQFVDEFVKIHKVASCEATDLDMIDYVISLDKAVIISTGGLDNSQIDTLIDRYPEDQITLMDCVIDYPARPDQYDLSILTDIQAKGIKVGLSDHTTSYVTAIAAQHLGATIFEKHVNFDWVKDSPDASTSIDRTDFEIYCSVIRNKTHGRMKKISSRESSNVRDHQRRQLEHGFYRPI